MDGWEINHVEPHRFGVVNPAEASPKGRAAIGPALGGAGEKFIPGGGAGGDAIDRYPGRGRVLGRAVAGGVGGHQDFKLAEVRDAVDFGVRARAHFLGQLAQAFGVGAAGAPGGGGEKFRAFEFLARQIGEAGFKLGRVLVHPAPEDIGPGFDRVFIGGVFVEGKDAAPTIVVDQLHRGLVPVGLTDDAPFENSGDDVVAILEDVGLDDHVFADDPLDRVTAAIDERFEVLDDSGRE